jgi:hypothetical protein
LNEKLLLRGIMMGCHRDAAEEVTVETLTEAGVLPSGFAIDGPEDPAGAVDWDKVMKFLMEWIPKVLEMLKLMKPA